MNTDDLIYIIGKLSIEKEVLQRMNADLQERVRALEESQAQKSEKE